MQADTLLAFINEIGMLKTLPRTAWRMHNIKGAESVADHSFRMALLSMALADVLAAQGVALDVERVMRLALLHEIAEARLTDIPYPAFRYIPEDVKESAERAAVEDMLAGFGALGERYIALWEEFEAAETLEARLVRAADKLELLVQVYEYERAGFRSLDAFWANAWNQRFLEEHDFTREFFEALVALRGSVIEA